MLGLIALNHVLEAIGVYAFIFGQYEHKRNAWVDRGAVLLTYVLLFSVYQVHSLNLNIVAMLVLYCLLFHYLLHVSWRESVHNAMIIFSVISI